MVNDWGSPRDERLKVVPERQDSWTNMYSQVNIVLMLLDNKFCPRKSLSDDMQELVFRHFRKLE